MKLKGHAVWRRCNTYKDWSIDEIFIDREDYSASYGGSEKNAKQYVKSYKTDGRKRDLAKLIGLKHMITPVTVIAFKPRRPEALR